MNDQIKLEVLVTNTSTIELDLPYWETMSISFLSSEGINSGYIDCSFVSEEEISELNKQYMKKNGSTDVLSFPNGPVNQEVPSILGDVVICPEVALRQSIEHDWPFEAELTLLLSHGILHVLGHDHFDKLETELMRSRESEHLKLYGYEHRVWDDK